VEMCRSRIGGSEAIIDFEPVEMCRSRIRGSEAIIDFEPEESFDDEDHDSADDTESRSTLPRLHQPTPQLVVVTKLNERRRRLEEASQQPSPISISPKEIESQPAFLRPC
jgi:hypothetical protein